MGNSKIEWTEKVWNPVTGCAKISPGCQHCYAERLAKRFWPDKDFSRVTLHSERLSEPLHWRKPSRVFVCSMSDLFHEDVDDGFLCRVFDEMLVADHHTFLVLTKRPERMKDFITRCVPDAPKNIWFGVTAENQEQADKRIPILLNIPAAVRFVSVEPMLGPIDLTNITLPAEYQAPHTMFPSITGFKANALRDDDDHFYQSKNHIDWIICGGETGPGARPMHPDWARDLRDQCQTAGTPFFFKQWGEWVSFTPNYPGIVYKERATGEISLVKTDGKKIRRVEWSDDGDIVYARVGKKVAGRMLGGREWNEYPETINPQK